MQKSGGVVEKEIVFSGQQDTISDRVSGLVLKESLAVVDIEVIEEETTVYNFEVEDDHTYFVTDAEVWVHNAPPTYTIKPGDGTKSQIAREQGTTRDELVKANPNSKWRVGDELVIPGKEEDGIDWEDLKEKAGDLKEKAVAFGEKAVDKVKSWFGGNESKPTFNIPKTGKDVVEAKDATENDIIRKKSSSVKLDNLNPKLAEAFPIIAQEFKNQGKNATITSGNDSKHKTGSFHYTDDAIDIRGKIFSDKKQLEVANNLQKKLGKGYQVISEYYNNPDLDHLHIAYREDYYEKKATILDYRTKKKK